MMGSSCPWYTIGAGKALRDIAPLAAGSPHIHHAVNHFTAYFVYKPVKPR